MSQEHDLFISRVGSPGEWLTRVETQSRRKAEDSKQEDWGAAVTAARILLVAGTAEAWVGSEEGQEVLRGQLEQNGMSPPADVCPVAWAAGGKGAEEGHSVWGLFSAAKRTLRMAPEKRSRV